MEVQRVLEILRAAPEVAVSAATTRAEVRASYRSFGTLDGRELGGRRWSGVSPWERHPDGEELLMPLEGSYSVTVLDDAGNRTTVVVEAGSLFIVPQGVWHRVHAPMTVIDFGASAIGYDSPVSFAEDPRLPT